MTGSPAQLSWIPNSWPAKTPPGASASRIRAHRAGNSCGGLVADYEHENDPLPVPGLRQVVVDSAGRPVGVIETTAVRVMRLADVDLDHAVGEGEGFTSVAEWRAVHEQFWHSAEMRQALGDPVFTIDDDTLVVASEFRLIQH